MSRRRVNGDNGVMTIFIDGSCDTVTKNGAYAVVVVNGDDFSDKKYTCISRGYKETTNNKMELLAYLRALKYIYEHSEGYKRAVIYSDSAYVVNGVNSWMYGWRINDWCKADGNQILNVDIWRKAYEKTVLVQSELKLDLRKVKAHSGNPLNEFADQLAKAQSGIELEIEKEAKFILN